MPRWLDAKPDDVPFLVRHPHRDLLRSKPVPLTLCEMDTG